MIVHCTLTSCDLFVPLLFILGIDRFRSRGSLYLPRRAVLHAQAARPEILESSILLLYKLILSTIILHAIQMSPFDQDVEDPMNACLSPEPLHVSLPINPRLMCWPETKIKLLLLMLSYA